MGLFWMDIGYAMSETLAISIDVSTKPDSVGWLFSGIHIKITDEDGNRCGIDKDGEICVKTKYKLICLLHPKVRIFQIILKIVHLMFHGRYIFFCLHEENWGRIRFNNYKLCYGKLIKQICWSLFNDIINWIH